MKTASTRPTPAEPVGKVTPASSRCAPPENRQDACFTSPHRAGFAPLSLLLNLALGLLLVLAGATEADAQNTHRAALVRASAQHFSTGNVYTPGTGPITLEAWVKSGQVGSVFSLAKNGTRVFINFTLGAAAPMIAEIAWVSGGAQELSVTGIKIVGDLAWHHVALVLENVAGRAKITQYVDGNLDASATHGSLAYDISVLSYGYFVGVRKYWGTGVLEYPFDGYMDDVRVWSTARTQAQIQAAMFSELAGTESGLRGYWKLNNTTTDASGNGNTLTPVNNPTFATNDLPFSGSASYSISGTISATNPPAGTIRVTATSTSTAASGTFPLSAPGPYSISSLPSGQSYNVSAYVDANGNGVRDAAEWSGQYAANPVLLDANKTAINITMVVPVPGTVDSNFAPNANSVVFSTTVQPDTKIVIAGNFTSVGGVTRNFIARLNADGTLDGGFNPNANGGVNCCAMQADGKIMIGGGFSTVGGVLRNGKIGRASCRERV